MGDGACPECGEPLRRGYRAPARAASLAEVLVTAVPGDAIRVYRDCPACEWQEVRLFECTMARTVGGSRSPPD